LALVLVLQVFIWYKLTDINNSIVLVDIVVQSAVLDPEVDAEAFEPSNSSRELLSSFDFDVPHDFDFAVDYAWLLVLLGGLAVKHDTNVDEVLDRHDELL
jgi:hypothetical protein